MPDLHDSKKHVLLNQAVDQFNAGAYFSCHETLENFWISEKGATRDLYKGILQIAVALFHKNRGNLRGAVRLLDSGAKLLEPFLPVFAGLDLGRLHDEALALCEVLESESRPELLEHPRIHFLKSRGETGPLLFSAPPSSSPQRPRRYVGQRGVVGEFIKPSPE